MGGGGESNTSQLLYGGYGGPPGSTRYATTEAWNGTSWTEVADLSAARSTKHGLPSAAAANQLYAGGHTPAGNFGSATEEWAEQPATSSFLTEGSLFLSKGTTLKGFGKAAGIPAATWASGGTMNTARDQLAAAGNSVSTSTLVFGGDTTPHVDNSEQYDGSSWTEVAELNNARRLLSGAGTNTAALAMAGFNGPPGSQNVNATEKYDGTSWTEVNEQNTARRETAGNGTQTSALLVSGYTGTAYVTNVESWDGTNFTEIAEVNTGRAGLESVGTDNTTALAFGGNPPTTAKTELWDGSSWTEVGDLNTARYNLKGSGNSSGAIGCGGGPPTTAKTESWNGSSWTEVNDLSTARYFHSGAGTGVSSLAAGGSTGSDTGATEEFTAPLANKTITAS